MIRFTTRNSKYEVTVQDSKFHIKKYESLNEESTLNLVVGQTVVSTYLDLERGWNAKFAALMTSEVTKIEEVG